MQRGKVGSSVRGVTRAAVGGWWTAATILGALACSDEPAGPEHEPLEAAQDLSAEPDVAREGEIELDPGHAPDRDEDVYPFPHHADAPEIIVYWAAVPRGVEVASSVVLVVESTAADVRRVTPRVLVRGLDDRKEEVELEAFELEPRGHIEIEIDLERLPLQGISHSVTLQASGTFGAEEGDVTVQAEPLAFHFDEGYERAYVYTLDTMVAELHGGWLVEDPRQLRGRVDDGERFVDVTGTMESDEIPDGLGEIEYTYEISAPEGRMHDGEEGGVGIGGLGSPIDPAAGNDPGPGPGPSPDPDFPPVWCQWAPWDCCTGDNCVDVCADWTTAYVDATASGTYPQEDHALGTGTQTVDASYAEFDITKTTCGGIYCYKSTVTSGLLGPDGCATLDLPPGSGYGLRAKTKLRHGVSGNVYPVEHHTQNDPAANVGVVAISKGFTVPLPGSPLPPPMVTLPQHQAANAAAALSRMLASGVVVDQPTGFTTNAGLGCSSPGVPSTDACAGDEVSTGPYTNPDNSPGDLRWKFVLAHELGHVVQRKAMGSLWNPYCFTPQGDLTTNCAPPNTGDLAQMPVSCRCDHVSGSNGLHCLQSLEYTPVAQLEGYAQFFAARVWNDADDTCLFRYYKQFRKDDGSVKQPPFNASCASFVNWRDNHCFSHNGGTEYDWLQFLWNVHAVGSNKLSMHEIFEVYRGACSDEWCGGEAPEWPAIEASAAAYFGAGSAKHGKVVAAGNSAGVDATKF